MLLYKSTNRGNLVEHNRISQVAGVMPMIRSSVVVICSITCKHRIVGCSEYSGSARKLCLFYLANVPGPVSEYVKVFDVAGYNLCQDVSET